MLLQARAADNDPRATFCDRWINDRGLLLDDDAIDIAKAAYLAFFQQEQLVSADYEVRARAGDHGTRVVSREARSR